MNMKQQLVDNREQASVFSSGPVSPQISDSQEFPTMVRERLESVCLEESADPFWVNLCDESQPHYSRQSDFSK